MLFRRFFAVSSIAVLLLSACKENSIDEVEGVRKDMETNKEIADNIEIIYSDSGHVKARLTAPEMQRVAGQNAYIEMPKGQVVFFYDTALNVESRLSSRYGIRYIDQRLTRLAYNVEIINQDGDTVNTEEMFWDEAKDRVYSDKFVKVRTPKETILAEGFESDVNLTNYTFKKIRAIINVKE